MTRVFVERRAEALLRSLQPGGLPLGPVLYLLAAAAYFLVATAPLTNIRYRLPLEPLLVVLLAEFVCTWLDAGRRRRGQRGAIPSTAQTR